MIVVVVADHDCVEIVREFGNGACRLPETLRTRELDRRATVAEDRIAKDDGSVDFGKNCSVAEPSKPQSGLSNAFS